MIAHLQGILHTKKAEEIVIDVHGVGYFVLIPLSTYYKLPEQGEKVSVYIYTHVREDTFQLFGFFTSEERKTFELLLKVDKVGPKLARSILSHILPEEFRSALLSSAINRLNSIPGIGEKTARRLILELKDKIPQTISNDLNIAEEDTAASLPQENTIQEDVITALVNLGYSKILAERTVNKILLAKGNNNHEFSLEELMKKALSQLGKRF